MKKGKLSLKDLKVKSFVTHVESGQVLGGATLLCLNTLPLNDCISNNAYSACRTCGVVCYDV